MVRFNKHLPIFLSFFFFNAYSTWSSEVVSHPSTNQAPPCLASDEIRHVQGGMAVDLIHISSSKYFLEVVHSYCPLTAIQTHISFPSRVLPPLSDLWPRPSPTFRLTCRKREVLLVESQWNSTALSCEGSTWGSITPMDSGTSAGLGSK